MSGATKGYRYIVALSGEVISVHHTPTGAKAAVYANRHRPAVAFRLRRPLPIRYGDAVPDDATPVTPTVTARRGRPRIRDLR